MTSIPSRYRNQKMNSSTRYKGLDAIKNLVKNHFDSNSDALFCPGLTVLSFPAAVVPQYPHAVRENLSVQAMWGITTTPQSPGKIIV